MRKERGKKDLKKLRQTGREGDRDKGKRGDQRGKGKDREKERERERERERQRVISHAKEHRPVFDANTLVPFDMSTVPVSP